MVSLVKKSTLLTALLINASSYAAADRTYTIKPYNTADHQVDICEIIEEHMPSLFPPSLPTDASWKAVLNKIESKHSSVAVICDEASSVVGFINYEASQVSEEEYWTQGFTETKLLPSELVEKIFP